jgi:hypothetical protein
MFSPICSLIHANSCHSERPPEVSSFFSSIRGLFVFHRQFYLIPSIKRSDDYSCRTESTVLSGLSSTSSLMRPSYSTFFSLSLSPPSPTIFPLILVFLGDDMFTTEEWLLSRPSDWSTNPNWSKVETQSNLSALMTKSDSAVSLRIDPNEFDTNLLCIAQAIRRMNCEISTLWKRGLIGAQKSSDAIFFLEVFPLHQKISIYYGFRSLQTSFSLMMHVDEMLDHWSERFKGYEWLKYAVVQEDEGDVEDLIPIQSIHLAMADLESEVQSVTLSKKYKIDTLAPDLLLPPNLLLTFEKDLQIGRQIGKGGFANIFEGKYQKQTVAVKMCNVKAPIISQFDSEEEKKKKEAARYRASVRAWRKFWHEIMMLYEAKGHPNTLQLLGYCRSPFCIVTAFLPHGDLYHLLANEYQYRTIPYTASLRFALGAAECLQNLHRKNPPILHNDFKSPNIFLDVKNQKTFEIDCYLGDFGCARRCFAPVLSKRRLVANPGWLAPEQISGDYFTEKVDVYSFGVYLHELLSRQHPFSEYRIKNKQLFEEQIVGGLRPTIPEKWPMDYRMLITDCWQTKAELRPSFDEIVERLRMALAVAEEGGDA